MTIKFRTIDDLGIEASNTYAHAKKQEELDQLKKVEDARFVTRKTEVPVTTPYTPAEVDERFFIGETTHWADFPAPQGFERGAARLFTYQLVASLGSADQQQTAFDKFSEMQDTIKEPADQQAYKTIHSALELLLKGSRTLELINARRNQYQRG